MVKSQLSTAQKSRALALLEQGMSVIRVAAEMQVTRMTIYRLKKAGNALPPGTAPQRKEGSGRPRKTLLQTDLILKREVMLNPSITALELKEKHPELLKKVTVRTIQYRLQKDLKLPERRAAMKPLLTENIKKKRLQFCKKYQHSTSEEVTGRPSPEPIKPVLKPEPGLSDDKESLSANTSGHHFQSTEEIRRYLFEEDSSSEEEAVLPDHSFDNFDEEMNTED